MPSVTYSTLTTILNITVPGDIAATEAEALIDHAANTLNIFGADISNMSGTAGSKTVGLDSEEAGAVIEIASDLYYLDFQKKRSATSVGSAAIGQVTMVDVLRKAEVFARRLAKPKGSTG